jgi:hypothetical protein
VEGDSGNMGIYDKAKILIGEDTAIYRDYSFDKFEANNLKEGLSVEVIFVDGPMIMIYPPQAQAKIIRVID